MDQKELREQENRCIQEHAPACSATCPVHVDVRGMTLAISKGDFESAYQLYRKSVPFPGIVSRICAQPCQPACLRVDLGGAIEIAALERACVEFARPDEEAVKLFPQKSKKVAVIGAGISGLTVAHDLARKGWQITVYEATDRIGGGLWQTPPDLLPRDVILRDLDLIEKMGVKILLNTVVGRSGGNGHSTFLGRLLDEYDAVYLGIGPLINDIPDLRLDDSGQIAINPLTSQSSMEKVFVGGDVLRVSAQYPLREIPHSAILSISEGRRAALSIDRMLQKVSLTAARFMEGSYTTKLYTNTSAIQAESPLEPTQLLTFYEREVAETEAARCIQCECMECVRVCEYLEEYKGYPKKYIREIYNNLSIVMGTRFSNQFINSCTLCGLCGEVCPTELDMGVVCKESRAIMVEQDRMPASAHSFALDDMAFSNSQKFSLARNAPGTTSSAYAFFPGCQLSASYPHHVGEAYAFLREVFPQEGVGLMLGCCGAPADWAGRKDLLADTQAQFLDQYDALGQPTIILPCSSCYQVFQEHYPNVRILSFWDVYDHYGQQQFPEAAFAGEVAVHDPCSTRYEGHIQDSVRNILHKLGAALQELPLSREKTECCSYGGLVWLANRPLADKIVQRRVQASPVDYVTYCAMCRDFFVRAGKPSLHLIDLIFQPPGSPIGSLKPGPGFSQRHENRWHLKAKFLKELWGESMPEKEEYERIKLILPSDVQQMVEERLILVEDMQKVIDYALRTGKRMVHAASGHSLAYFKPNTVTYWVEYTPQEDGSFLVHRAYSHRMQIGKEEQT